MLNAKHNNEQNCKLSIVNTDKTLYNQSRYCHKMTVSIQIMQKLTQLIIENFKHHYISDAEIKVLLGAQTSDNSRYAIVKRALRSGELKKIKRGLYSLSEKYRTEKLNLLALADLIYYPSYISLQSALDYYGMVPEGVYSITSVTSKKTKEFNTPFGNFYFHSVPKKFFHFGITRVEKNGVFLVAEPLKALLDYIYIFKKDWKNIEDTKKDLRLNDSITNFINTNIINEYYKNCKNVRVKNFLNGLKE